METLYNQVGTWIQSIIRSSKPISPYISTIIIYLILLFLGYLVALIFGEAQEIPSSGLLTSTYLALSCAAVLIALFNIRKLLTSFREQFVDFIDSVDNLNDFQRCVTSQFFHKVKNIAFSAFFLILSILTIYLIKSYSIIYAGAAFCAILIISNSFFGIAFYFIIMMLFIPSRLSRYHYKLHAVNPSQSEVIVNLTRILNTYTYIVAIFVAVATVWVNIFFSSEDLFIWFILITVIINWIPIIIQFRTNQSSIRKIVFQGKIKTLTEIQHKIEYLHANLELGERKTINAINRLMDYHDRIAKVRISTFNLNAIVNLLNQLFIPFAAIILANLEKLIGLIP